MSKRKITLEESSDFDLITQLKLEKEKFQKTNSQKKFTLGRDKQVKKKTSLFDRANKGVETRQKRDQLTKDPKTLEESEKLEISRKSLEKKAKIYDLLKKKGKEIYTNEGEEEIRDKFGENILTEKFLINFEAKGFNSDSDNEEKEHDNNGEEGDSDEYLEIQDEFGRTRKILKKEFKNYEDDYFLDENNQPQLMSEDMKRERQRLQWEQETLREIKMGPEHYNQSSETRQLGVGFYKFSLDQEERAKQMEELNKLRRETERIRKENELNDLNKKKLVEDRKSKLKRMREKRQQISNAQTEEVNAFLDSLMPKHLGEDDDDDDDNETEN